MALDAFGKRTTQNIARDRHGKRRFRNMYPRKTHSTIVGSFLSVKESLAIEKRQTNYRTFLGSFHAIPDWDHIIRMIAVASLVDIRQLT